MAVSKLRRCVTAMLRQHCRAFDMQAELSNTWLAKCLELALQRAHESSSEGC